MGMTDCTDLTQSSQSFPQGWCSCADDMFQKEPAVCNSVETIHLERFYILFSVMNGLGTSFCRNALVVLPNSVHAKSPDSTADTPSQGLQQGIKPK